jgi:hypothetical protein
VELFFPVASRHRCLKQQGVDHIIDGAISSVVVGPKERGVVVQQVWS